PLIGMGGDQLLPALGLRAGSLAGQEAAQLAGRRFLERYLEDVRSFPLARELLGRARDGGATIVAATSADPKIVAAILHHTALTDMFTRVTDSSDADESKPSPDILVAALTAMGEEPRDALMIGDTPYDVAAAARANVRCIAFRCGGWRDADLAGALEVHDDPAALLDAWTASIIGEVCRSRS
ncbi:MAG TPA: HAD-IA family hydrolase, partial [Polyangiaceae bacterium]|nr:HAD-IA family hydrolase [Polyangiaceae bacterium]